MELAVMNPEPKRNVERVAGELAAGLQFMRRKRRSKLLVVDDENGPRQALRMLLKEEFDVALASGVEAAERILHEGPVDVIISDIRMPHLNGLDLLRRIKKDFPDIQVILLTGYGQLDTAVEAIEHGAFAYLEKPFDNQVMVEKVRSCLEKRQREEDRRALEHLAIEANRFETLGRLISGTMHDLGTPLSVIATHLDMLSDHSERPDREKRLDSMRSQVQHCMDLVRTSMNLLRSSPEDCESYDINEITRLCLEMARPLMNRLNIELHTELCPNLGLSDGYLVLMRQAILNLINNACQAMESQEQPRKLLVETWSEGGNLCLAIEDNGPGVPVDDQDRIFETLFSTKGGGGTGLGLTVVKNVMNRHGGTVEIESARGNGARFILRLPRNLDG